MLKKYKVNMKKKKEKIELFNFGEEVSIAQNSGIYPNIILTGNRSVKVEGCKSIVEYSAQSVKINYGRGYININGTDLKITMLDGNEVMVDGIILSVEFC